MDRDDASMTCSIKSFFKGLGQSMSLDPAPDEESTCWREGRNGTDESPTEFNRHQSKASQRASASGRKLYKSMPVIPTEHLWDPSELNPAKRLSHREDTEKDEDGKGTREPVPRSLSAPPQSGMQQVLNVSMFEEIVANCNVEVDGSKE